MDLLRETQINAFSTQYASRSSVPNLLASRLISRKFFSSANRTTVLNFNATFSMKKTDSWKRFCSRKRQISLSSSTMQIQAGFSSSSVIDRKFSHFSTANRPKCSPFLASSSSLCRVSLFHFLQFMLPNLLCLLWIGMEFATLKTPFSLLKNI